MADLISRQAAIEAVCAVCGKSCDKSEFVYNAPQDEQVILCPEHYVLCTLPSAQPEIIRCKECKHWDGVDTCDVIDAPVWDNDFCSMAERRSNE